MTYHMFLCFFGLFYRVSTSAWPSRLSTPSVPCLPLQTVVPLKCTLLEAIEVVEAVVAVIRQSRYGEGPSVIKTISGLGDFCVYYMAMRNPQAVSIVGTSSWTGSLGVATFLRRLHTALTRDPGDMGFWTLRAMMLQAITVEGFVDSTILENPLPARFLEEPKWDKRAVDNWMKNEGEMALIGGSGQVDSKRGGGYSRGGTPETNSTKPSSVGLDVTTGIKRDVLSKLELDYWDYGEPDPTQGVHNMAMTNTHVGLKTDSGPKGGDDSPPHAHDSSTTSDPYKNVGAGHGVTPEGANDLTIANQAGAWDASFFKTSFNSRSGDTSNPQQGQSLLSSRSPRGESSAFRPKIGTGGSTEHFITELPSTGSTRGRSMQPLSPLREDDMATGIKALVDAKERQEDAKITQTSLPMSKESVQTQQSSPVLQGMTPSGSEVGSPHTQGGADVADNSVLAGMGTTGLMGFQKPAFLATSPDLSKAIAPGPIPVVRKVGVSVAVSEDLVCAYRGAALQSYVVTGQVLVSACEVSFHLCVRDEAGLISKVKVNPAFAKELTGPTTPKSRLYQCRAVAETMSPSQQRADSTQHSEDGRARPKFLPTLMYQCAPLAKQVPVRIQCRLSAAGNTVNLSAQAVANPKLSHPLSSVVVLVSVPVFSSSEKGAMKSKPPAEWRADRRVLEWRVPNSILPGGKQLLQAQFTLEKEASTTTVPALPTSAPIILKCLCAGSMFSSVEFSVDEATSQQEAGGGGAVHSGLK
ncbi:unnamed protein product [Choristocarpus tenellus]